MTADRSLIARLAAHESWARTADPSARTATARRALLDRFERQVDPDGVLPPAERARRAGHARKACFARLALQSAQARRKMPASAVRTAGRRCLARTHVRALEVTEAATCRARPGGNGVAVGGRPGVGANPANCVAGSRLTS